MICKKCGEENNERYEFCTGCGGSMKAAPPPSPPLEPTVMFSGGGGGDESGARRKLEKANLLVGQVLDGKYRLDETVGVGGMGAVYRATRLKIGDEVAVKILHPEKVEEQSADRFRREAQMAARLKHPNAVTIFDFDVSEGGLLYLVMELVAGESLRRIIRLQGALAPQTVAVVAEQVCAALDEAHRQGIIHRDIKPDNIIVNAMPNGFLRVKVLDFGLAKLFNITTSDLTQPGVVMGTPRYMSPEQCMGEEIDGRSDIYSFGVVLYEMLVGAAPFDAPTSTGIAVQHVTKQPPPPRSLNPNVPPPVETVVMRSLQKQKEARQQTAAALAQELHGAVHGTSSGASQPHFSGGFSPPPVVNTSAHENFPTQPTIVSTPLSGRQAINPTVFSQGGAGFDAAPAFASNYAERRGNSGKLFLIAGSILGLLLLLGGGAAIVLWQMRGGGGTDEQAKNAQQNILTKNTANANTNSAANFSNSANFNSSQTSPADEEFTRLETKLDNAAPNEKDALDSELRKAEDKYPSDYRFTYQRAKLEARTSREHHEAFEMLNRAGEKSIKANKSAEMLSDLQTDKNSDFRRLSSGHKEWTTLENALRNKDVGALEGKKH